MKVLLPWLMYSHTHVYLREVSATFTLINDIIYIQHEISLLSVRTVTTLLSTRKHCKFLLFFTKNAFALHNLLYFLMMSSFTDHFWANTSTLPQGTQPSSQDHQGNKIQTIHLGDWRHRGRGLLRCEIFKPLSTPSLETEILKAAHQLEGCLREKTT